MSIPNRHTASERTAAQELRALMQGSAVLRGPANRNYRQGCSLLLPPHISKKEGNNRG
jgi:hypothetical protein